MTLESQVLESVEALEPVASGWDELAVSLSRPYSAPGWLIPWYRHVAPSGSVVRVVVVRDERGIAALAPFYGVRRRGVWTYAVPATDMSAPVEPLVRADVRDEALRTVADALARVEPAPAIVELRSVPAGWTDRLRAAWPGSFVHARPAGAAPVAPVEADDADAWLKSRSSNFRQQMRRFRRRLGEAGAEWRATEDPDRLTADVEELERLHRGRLERTDAFPAGATAMLAEAGRELLASGRFRLGLIEVDGKAVNAQLFVGAGDELSYWNGGFDDEYGQLRPSYVGLVDAVGAAIEGGYKRFDLGQGTQPYKSRFADDAVELETVTLVPPGRRRVLGRAAYAPAQARYAVASRLTDEQKARLKRLLPGGRAKPAGDA